MNTPGRPIGATGERYITYTNNKYRVQKRVDGRQVDYGGFNSLHEAIVHRNYCHINEWDLRCKANLKDPSMRYIQRLPSGGYQVSKTMDKNKIHYGYFDNLQDAQRHRDYCVSHDWSKDCIMKTKQCYDLPKHISYNKGKYVVQKYFGKGEVLTIRFNNLVDAVHERDLLMSVDWDEERLMELDECEGTL